MKKKLDYLKKEIEIKRKRIKRIIKLQIGLTLMFIRRNIIFINVNGVNIASNTRSYELQDHKEIIKLLINMFT